MALEKFLMEVKNDFFIPPKMLTVKFKKNTSSGFLNPNNIHSQLIANYYLKKKGYEILIKKIKEEKKPKGIHQNLILELINLLRTRQTNLLTLKNIQYLNENVQGEIDLAIYKRDKSLSLYEIKSTLSEKLYLNSIEQMQRAVKNFIPVIGSLITIDTIKTFYVGGPNLVEKQTGQYVIKKNVR